MSSFTQARLELATRPDGSQKLRDGRLVYRLLDDFVFYIGDPDDPEIRVKRGFETDGPSWPRWVKRVLPRGLHDRLIATMLRSSIVHDHCREHLAYPKCVSDGVFWIAMHVEKTPRALRELAFVLVRLNQSRIQHNAPGDDRQGRLEGF